MKKKLRSIIALLKSRAYLDSQEAAERKHPPRKDSHHEYERGQNEPSQPAISEHQNNAPTGLSDPAISIQLEYLLDCGLVKVRQAGQRVLYGLNVLRLLQLDEAVEETLIAALKYTSSNQRNSI